MWASYAVPLPTTNKAHRAKNYRYLYIYSHGDDFWLIRNNLDSKDLLIKGQNKDYTGQERSETLHNAMWCISEGGG
jgi:hypothetical protein